MGDNESMVKYLIENEYADEKVANALRAVPRELFVLKKEEAYLDIPLPIGYGQTISAPSMVAVMTKTLAISEGMKVLEIGTGSGWQAAVLAELVGRSGHVYTIERIGELTDYARKNIGKLGYRNIDLLTRDGSGGFEEKAPFDRILVSAAASEVPKPLIGQLAENGKLLIPVGTSHWQTLMLIEKANGSINKTEMMDVLFVPLIGRYGFKE